MDTRHVSLAIRVTKVMLSSYGESTLKVEDQ